MPVLSQNSNQLQNSNSLGYADTLGEFWLTPNPLFSYEPLKQMLYNHGATLKKYNEIIKEMCISREKAIGKLAGVVAKNIRYHIGCRNERKWTSTAKQNRIYHIHKRRDLQGASDWRFVWFQGKVSINTTTATI